MKEEERIAEIVDERIDARIIELMDCPGCKLLLNRLSQQECVISKQEKEIKGLKELIPHDTTFTCRRCWGKGFVQYGSFGKKIPCPNCNKDSQ